MDFGGQMSWNWRMSPVPYGYFMWLSALGQIYPVCYIYCWKHFGEVHIKATSKEALNSEQALKARQ